MKKYLLLSLFVLSAFSACDRSNEPILDTEDPSTQKPINKLKLSAGWNIYTQDVEYEFDILDGNGGYTASVLGQDAGKVIIEGTKVKVSLLKSHVSVTITDQEQQSETVIINSTSKSLISSNYSISLDNGDTYTMKNISFGAGEYTVEKIKGSSAEVTIVDNHYVKIVTLRQGNSYYKLRDKRGTTAPLNVMVGATYDLVEDNILITAVNDQTFSVILKHGKGWKVTTSKPYSPIISEIYLMPNATVDKKYDVLQVNTAEENVKGKTVIELKDEAGNRATVTVTIG